MAWYEDLSQCDYFGPEYADCLLAIGWLEKDQDYPKGEIDQSIYDRLCELLNNPFEPMVFMGHHGCDYCQFPKMQSASTNLFVPNNKIIFVCPELILHYIDTHWYKPPDVFCEAVMACPPTRSMEYKKLFLNSGGRALIKNGS